MFEKRVLRNYLDLREDEMTGDWRRLLNEGLHDRYFSPHIIRLIKIKKNVMGWACVTYGRQERCIEGFGGGTREKEGILKTCE